MQSPTNAQRPKFKRSRAGCLTCRKRKVKCDMTTPVCLKCTSLSRECTYPNPNIPQSNKRKRTSNSCHSHDSDAPESSTHPDRSRVCENNSYNDPFSNPTRSLKRLQTLLGAKLLSQLIQSAPDIKFEGDDLNLPSIYDPAGDNPLPVPSTGSAMSLLPSSTPPIPQPSFFDPPSSRILPSNLEPAMMNSNSLATVSVPFNSFNSEWGRWRFKSLANIPSQMV